MIVAYNEFPDTLVVSGDTINWETIKAYPYITWLPDEDQNDISLLMVSIYDHVKKIAVKKGTLITPKQIEKRMKDFGYINVVRHCSECFNQSMLK